MAAYTRPRTTLEPAKSHPRAVSHTHRVPRSHLRSRAAAAVARTQTAPAAPNLALAGLALLVGYEWLLSGVDKLLFGAFPHALAGLLAQSLAGGQLPAVFAALLRALVVPHAAFFGYLIEWSEALAGLGLIAVGLVELLRPLAARHLTGAVRSWYAVLERLIGTLAPVAAAGAGLLGLSFFFLDGLPVPWFMPTIAYGGAIDTGLFLAAASAVLLAGRLAGSRRGGRN